MPNYNLVTTSKFRPFEYQELLAPVLMATQAQRELEDELAALDEQTGELSDKINPEIDKDLYNQYNNYYNELSEIATNLSTNGLTPNSRQQLLKARSRYRKEIAPIKEAYNKKLEDIKRQDALQDKSNGRMIFNRDARLSPLSDYYNGNIPEFAQANLDHIINAGVEGGKAISSRYVTTKEGQRFANDYYSLIKQTGIKDQNEVLEILKNSGKYPEFNKFYNDTLTNYGYDNFDEAGKRAMEAALSEGLNRGIVYSETESLQDNWRAKKALEHYYHEVEADADAVRDINKTAAIAGIKAEQDRQTQISTLFSPAIPQGVEGEPDKDLDRLEGLKIKSGINGEIGVSTNKLDKLATEVDKARKALADYEAEHPTAKNNPISATGQKGTTTYSNWYNKGQDTMAQDYNKWRKLKDGVDKAEANFNEEWNYLKGIEKQYSGYGDNMYERIKTASEARRAHTAQQKIFYGLNANNTSHTELKKAIGRLTSAGANVEYTANNGKVTGDQLANLLKDDNTAIGMTISKNGAFLSLNDSKGREYRIKGIHHIDDLNKRLSYINKKLGDFHSQRTSENIYNLPSNFVGGIEQALVEAIKAGKAANPKGTNMYAATIRMPIDNSGRTELINVVSDGYGVYYQTMADELQNRGMNRESIVKNIASAALVDLLPTLADKP